MEQVIAVGPGARNRDGTLVPVPVSVGDRVLLPEYGGQAVKVDDDEVFLFRGDDILAKFEK
jgi:chaperonin GroES